MSIEKQEFSWKTNQAIGIGLFRIVYLNHLRMSLGWIMQKNRRKKTRRKSDRIIQKTVEVLGTLERIAKGEEVDFTEAYADLVGMKDKLGRRKEDRKLGESLCATIEALACNPGSSLPIKSRPGDARPRKIRLTKISGQSDPKRTIVGWEEKPPIVGRRYQVFSEDGSVIRTSAVTKVAAGYVQTRRSVYQIEVLEGQRK